VSTDSKKTFKMRAELLRGVGHPTHNPSTKLYYVTASQISDFRRCKKRWYHKQVDKVKEPEKPGAELGTSVHSFIEHALSSGQLPEGFPENVKAIALSGQRFWPAPGTEMEIEHEFILRDPDVPLPMYGFIDIRTKEEVVDHKTTSDIAKWGKGAEQWQHDPQGVIYPAANLSLGGKPKFRIIYYQTKGRKADEVVVDMTPGQIRFGLQQIGRDVKEMLDLAQRPLAEVPHNTEACSDYGGCYMRPLCAKAGVVPANLGAYAEVWAALYQTPEPAAPAQPQESPMSMNEASSYRERMAAQRAAAAAKAAQLSDPEGEEVSLPVPAPQAAAAATEAPTVNPYDGITQSPATKEDLDAVMKIVAPVAQADDEEDETSESQPSAPAGEKRGRGRPPGAKNRSTVERESSSVAAAVVTPVSASVTEQLEVPAVAGEGTSHFEKAVSAIEKELAAAKDEEAKAVEEYKSLRVKAMDGDEEAFGLVPGAKKRADTAAALLSAIGSRLADAKKALADAVVAEAKRREEAKTQEAARRILEENRKVVVSSQVSAPKVNDTEARTFRVMYLNCSPEKDTEGLVHFDDWFQQFARRAEAARQTPYYRMMPHQAVDAVMAEILADLRSGAQEPPAKLVFRRFSAQYFQYAQDLRPFYDEVIS